MGLEEEKTLDQAYTMPTFARKDVEFVSGDGMTLVDDTGKEYLDFLGGIGVVSLGHCHPALVEAISKQAQKLIHVSNYYYIEKRGEVAETISSLLNGDHDCDVQGEPTSQWKSFFANSGAEANECAIKLARLYARKSWEDQPYTDAPANIIVTLQRSFHGRTLATLAATAQPVKQEAFQPLPEGFISVPINDVAALEQLFSDRGDEICAVMVECIQGESGIHLCTKEFLQAVRRLTRENHALLICDEVQSGIYRTGRPFAFQHFDIVPDVVSIAKGVASGIPIGICAARAQVADVFEPGDHGSTFGGSNIAVSAAYVTLDTLMKNNFGTQVTQIGEYMRDRLAEIPEIREVRGLGLMVGADLSEEVCDLSAYDVVTKALDKGLIINATGSSTLRFLPPLICGKTDVDNMVDKLASIIGNSN